MSAPRVPAQPELEERGASLAGHCRNQGTPGLGVQGPGSASLPLGASHQGIIQMHRWPLLTDLLGHSFTKRLTGNEWEVHGEVGGGQENPLYPISHILRRCVCVCVLQLQGCIQQHLHQDSHSWEASVPALFLLNPQHLGQGHHITGTLGTELSTFIDEAPAMWWTFCTQPTDSSNRPVQL